MSRLADARAMPARAWIIWVTRRKSRSENAKSRVSGGVSGCLLALMSTGDRHSTDAFRYRPRSGNVKASVACGGRPRERSQIASARARAAGAGLADVAGMTL